MGESKRKREAALAAEAAASAPQVVDTLGGRVQVRWDEAAAATPHRQLVFFAEFLATTCVFERWVSSCPLQYSSGNAPGKRDVLGTLLLGMLAGDRRYAHITALRGDAVAAAALGMNRVVSEDALHRLKLEQEPPGGDRAPAPEGRHRAAAAHRRPATAARSAAGRVSSRRAAVGVRGAGHRGGLPDRGHRAAVPRPGGRGERLRRAEEPVGPGRLHHAGHDALPDDGAACALVYNWWSWYCRAAHPTARMEAITSRPLLLAAVGTAAKHAGQTTLYLTPLHGKAHILKQLIANVGAALQHVRATAEQFASLDRWGCLLRYVSDRIAPILGPPKPPPGLPATG